MQIDITRFFTAAADPAEFSASQFELGADAARITWNNACTAAADFNFLSTDDQAEEFRDYIKTFGAWTAEEIQAWPTEELNALFLQMISGDIREIESLAADEEGEIQWDQLETLSEAGTIAGRIWRTDDGTITYYIGC